MKDLSVSEKSQMQKTCIVCDFASVKYPEKANLRDQRRLEPFGGGHEGSFGGAENVLKPNCDGCTALLIYEKSLNCIL